MSGGSSPFDASHSALGYLHQCQYALLLGLRRDEEPNLCISIEKLDDIAFHENPSSPEVARQLLQVKHHNNRAAGLGDSSPDIWKTIRIWSEATAKHQIDFDRATLCLLTTTTPTNRNAIRFLSPDSQLRKPEDARSKMEQAGATSTSDTIKRAYLSLHGTEAHGITDTLPVRNSRGQRGDGRRLPTPQEPRREAVTETDSFDQVYAFAEDGGECVLLLQPPTLRTGLDSYPIISSLNPRSCRSSLTLLRHYG